MFNFLTKKTRMIEPTDALPGRSQPIPTAASHYVNGHPLQGPYPAGRRAQRSSAWAVSGARSGSSGRRARAST